MSRRRGFALAETELRSFDRSVSLRCHVQRPDRYRLIEALPADVPRITRGAGVSYVAASFANDSVAQDISSFDRILEFDAERGLIKVEAGVPIAVVVRFALSQGWLLPVAPGHPRASVGGCIAADVHGKNPARDGTFRRHVETIELFDPLSGWLKLDRTENGARFAACFAGFGIPGLIATATLRLVPAASGYSLRSVAVAGLREAREVLLAHATAPVLYGWHDGQPGCFGRGVIRFGLESKEPITGKTKRAADLPIAVKPWPVCAWNRGGIAAMNQLIRRRHGPGQTHVGIESALFPLNDARAYYAGFGAEGFVEAQWLLPHARYDEFVASLEAEVARLRPRISLIASKLFDGVAEGFSFDGKGISLAIQIPQPKAKTQAAFIESLTELALIHAGRPNLIKDSSLSAACVQRGIADFSSHRDGLRVFDPNQLQQSELTRRLEL
ncbi:MAG TPA: FAD-binding protein [Dokdonella sp.]|uniref:FAD-binding oxidoreductase n=1 Tax=Dokdonella sp. TaxID=2291710 RepID=UPI002D80B9FC|nr:FAD-binding protein [Dokdonella sp.]HET9031400.1 FAD-binding protein [Dokdonella sp.]